MPGAMGFLIMKTIHHTFPNTFGYEEDARGVADNHVYEPDVFFDNHSELHAQGLAWVLDNQGLPGIVLIHNINLLPKQLIETSKVFNVYCDIDSEARASFLSLIKNIGWHAQYIKDNFDDTAQGLFAELYRYTNFYRPPKMGKIIKFNQMHHVGELEDLLTTVQQEYGINNLPLINNKWYTQQYKKSVAPIMENTKLFNIWKNSYYELKKQHNVSCPNYTDIFAPGLQQDWVSFSNSYNLSSNA